MAAPTGRDPEASRLAIEAWLRQRLEVDVVQVSQLKIPRAGFSNETILGDAQWWDREVVEHRRPFALRIEASSHQLFQDPDAMRQAAVMTALAGHVPVPGVWLTEDDRSLFGAPFFLMDRVDGRIPPDLPSWHAKGWVKELLPEERARLYDNGLAALAALHRVDVGRLRFLEIEGPGSSLERYLAHIERWYRWCGPSIGLGAETIHTAMAYVLSHAPNDRGAQVSWGDARVGNMVFADDLSVAAMLDWEGTLIAPPGVDVGWWLMFEEYLSDAQGLRRLDGVADRLGTIERYQELSGQRLVAIEYYELVACLVFALINSRLVEILLAGGNVEPDVAALIVGRVVDMIVRRLPGRA
jgi:aminoglycoside phosphotransferase (APT) family kinase protein